MKKYTYKIYKPNGNYITTWSDASFEGFRKVINGGLGQCTFKLARQFDDFGENDDVKLNNKVEIYCSDGDTSSEGTKIYSGFISSYSPYINEGNEGVEVICLGYISKLATVIMTTNNNQLEIYTSTTLGITSVIGGLGAAALNLVLSTVIDLYRFYQLDPIINYSTSSLEPTTNTISYTFNGKFYSEVIELCRKCAPANWWWFIGADNIVKFKPKPTLATHNFVFGKHFKSIRVNKNMENVFNNVLLSNGDNASPFTYLYRDTDSMELYDDRWELITDSRISVDGTADNVGTSELAEKKDADVQTVIEILDNNGNESGYDIESINPGDTCKFLNLNTITSQTFSENMTIKSVDYNPDKVILELESLKVSAGKEIVENKKQIENQEASGRGAMYTTR